MTRSARRRLTSLSFVMGCGGLAVLIACGDSSFSGDGSPDASSIDATVDGAPVGDAAPDAITVGPADGGSACNLSKPFGAPVPIGELNTSGLEQTARLTHDELTIYFQVAAADGGIGSNPGDAGDAGPRAAFSLVTATRAHLGDPWGPISALASLDAGSNDTDPTVTGDNKTLYFTSDRNGTVGAGDLWVATRSTTVAPFGNVENVTSLNTGNDESEAYVMPDGLTLYFRSKKSGSFDLYRATRTSSSLFVVDPSNVFAAINGSVSVEELATVTLDELTVYFATDRGVPKSRDIWKATRASTAAVFNAPVAVDEVNTTSIDEPSWISDDGCRLYLSNNSSGSFDLYVATKPAN